jgi:hypothetical protein
MSVVLPMESPLDRSTSYSRIKRTPYELVNALVCDGNLAGNVVGENLSPTQELISPFTTGQNEMIKRLCRNLNEVGVTAQVFEWEVVQSGTAME